MCGKPLAEFENFALDYISKLFAFYLIINIIFVKKKIFKRKHV